MENEKINSKILKSNYIPTAEFYSQIIDSLQDYSIFTLDNEFVIHDIFSDFFDFFYLTEIGIESLEMLWCLRGENTREVVWCSECHESKYDPLSDRHLGEPHIPDV